MISPKHWKYKNIYHQSEYDLNSSLADLCYKNGTLDFLCKTYTSIDKKNIVDLISKIPQSNKIFSGNGIDLGGGPGLISGSLVNQYKGIKTIILLEIVTNVLEKCFPIVRSQLLAEEVKDKILPISGSFDEINLKTNTLNFAIAWDSIHHSFDPIKTLNEVNRTLVKGGYFVVVDRAHNNDTPDSEIQRMLNIQYSKEFISQNNLPEGTQLTRFENGEHEYRFRDWESFFKKSNFNIIYQGLFLEDHPRNETYLNDSNVNQTFVPYEIGSYERRKIIYVLQSK